MLSFDISKYGMKEFGVFLITFGILLFVIAASIYFYKIKATYQLSSLNVEITYEDENIIYNQTSVFEIDNLFEEELLISKDNISKDLYETEKSVTTFEINSKTIEVENIKIDSEITQKNELNKNDSISDQKTKIEQFRNDLIVGPENKISSVFLNDYKKIFTGNDFDQSILGFNAKYINIPIINLNSEIQELKLIDVGNSKEYNTPKNVVGHIPETAKPGEIGNSWYFGHLQSPLKDEGDVFRDLPIIAEKLKEGFPVYIVLYTETGEFVYQVHSTKVIHQDELNLYNSKNATVTLVTCVPKLIYDHRLIITARLVGVRKSIQSIYYDLN